MKYTPQQKLSKFLYPTMDFQPLAIYDIYWGFDLPRSDWTSFFFCFHLRRRRGPKVSTGFRRFRLVRRSAGRPRSPRSRRRPKCGRRRRCCRNTENNLNWIDFCWSHAKASQHKIGNKFIVIDYSHLLQQLKIINRYNDTK